MSHIIHVKLDGFVDGFFVIQPQYSEEEFRRLIQDKLPPAFRDAYAEVYRDFVRCKSGTIVCDDKSPWVIVVFGSDPRLIRRRALHEIADLAREIMERKDRRARFIDQSTPQGGYREEEMKPVEVTDERFARRLEEYERWRKEHPIRKRLVDALDRIISWLKLLRNALRW